jgi:hypothetical protein
MAAGARPIGNGNGNGNGDGKAAGLVSRMEDARRAGG